MAKYLVIVESPAKVKTIKKFLGSNYEVMASQGHIRDLPKSQLGVDVDNDYEPKYITIRGKGDILAALRKEAKKADKVYLATDPDREGEAISWHLAKALKLEDKDIYRITFNEITKNAVKASIKNARKIDMNLVDAQQSRRVLDRMVGYRISPLLWAKIKRGLSAGRVQSVALRIICDREDEINSFIPDEYWTIDADVNIKGEKNTVKAKFYGDENGKIDVKNGEQAEKIIEEVKKSDFSVESVKHGEKIKKVPLAFTTSTLQQEAAKQLNFATQKTMRLAQQLYEGVDIAGRGTIGIITYLRTDSTRIADEAVAAAAQYIGEQYGEEYVGTVHDTKEKKKIQDAHEAIRPTDISLSPAIIKDSLSRDQFRLYQLIWKRFTASQMSPAIYETASVKIAAGKYRFSVSASKIKFDGFLSVYKDDDEKSENKALIHGISEESQVSLADVKGEQHFTQPPAHFTEASLVKQLEELGIGRPSTYAPTITTILNREYVEKDGASLVPTELGIIVTKILDENFHKSMEVDFTADMESQLDQIEEGNAEWKKVVEEFYSPLAEAIKVAIEKIEKVNMDEETDEICELCGSNMVIKYGRFGKFMACKNYPECKNTKPIVSKIGVKCPKCKEGDIIMRKSKKKKVFYGCSNYPDCDFVAWNKPVEEPCEVCGSYMYEKYSKSGTKIVCSNKECKHEKIKTKRNHILHLYIL